MKEGINVLSLFDGMSCGQIALDKLGVKVNKYFACEIDKYAMQVTQHNFPDTIQLGDVQFVTKETFGNHKIDIIIGGSPCQGFSFAGKMLNFDDPRSKLFFEYVRLVKDLKPKYFLLENVKMKKESQDIITEYMGVEPIEINSALVSAQTRKRLYWTNIPNVGQPEDKGIVLKDILDYSVSKQLSEKEMAYMEAGNEKWTGAKNSRFEHYGKTEHDKAGCLTANQYKGVPYGVIGLEQVDGKLRHPEATKKGYAEAGEGEGLDLTFPQSNTRRGRAMKDKSNCLTAASHEMGIVEEHKELRPATNAYEDKKLVWRKLTPLECERLQTVPDGYTLVLDENGKQLVSDSQRYKMLGNGWTIDVITHIMKNIEL
jgi:DNA (cytosine-5)-methyltransferase 3A